MQARGKRPPARGSRDHPRSGPASRSTSISGLALDFTSAPCSNKALTQCQASSRSSSSLSLSPSPSPCRLADEDKELPHGWPWSSPCGSCTTRCPRQGHLPAPRRYARRSPARPSPPCLRCHPLRPSTDHSCSPSLSCKPFFNIL